VSPIRCVDTPRRRQSWHSFGWPGSNQNAVVGNLFKQQFLVQWRSSQSLKRPIDEQPIHANLRSGVSEGVELDRLADKTVCTKTVALFKVTAV